VKDANHGLHIIKPPLPDRTRHILDPQARQPLERLDAREQQRADAAGVAGELDVAVQARDAHRVRHARLLKAEEDGRFALEAGGVAGGEFEVVGSVAVQGDFLRGREAVRRGVPGDFDAGGVDGGEGGAEEAPGQGDAGGHAEEGGRGEGGVVGGEEGAVGEFRGEGAGRRVEVVVEGHVLRLWRESGRQVADERRALLGDPDEQVARGVGVLGCGGVLEILG